MRTILAVSTLVISVLMGPVPGASSAPAAAQKLAPVARAATEAEAFGPSAGSFRPLAPRQLVSTRKRKGGSTLQVAVPGHAGIPGKGVGSVVLTISATRARRAGAVTVYPADARRPSVPSLRYLRGTSASGQTTVRVPRGGRIAIHTSRPATLTVTTVGYHVAGAATRGGTFTALTPQSLLPTRTIGKGQTVTAVARGRAGVPTAAGTIMAAVTVTARKPGAVTVWGEGRTPPAASVRFGKRSTTTSTAWTPIGTDGRVRVRATTRAKVSIAVLGHLRTGPAAATGEYTAVTPKMVAATKARTANITVAGRAGVPAKGVSAVVVAIDSRAKKRASAVTVQGRGMARTPATLQVPKRKGAATTAVVPLPASGQLTVGASAATRTSVTVIGYLLAKDRTASTTVLRPTTLAPAASAIVSVTGRSSQTQTIVLRNSVRKPLVGHHVVAPVSARAPSGLLVKVTAVAAGSGTWIVTGEPASLTDAYSTFNVSSRQTWTAPRSDTKEQARRDQTSAQDSGTIGGFDCEFANGSPAPTVNVSIDPGQIKTDFTLEANVFAPYLNLSVAVNPTVTLTAGIESSVTCERAFPVWTRIYLGGTPPLELVVRPVIQISATGKISTTATWHTRGFVGILARKGDADFSHGFGSSASIVNTEAEASLDAAAVISAYLVVAGTDELADLTAGWSPRVAIGASIGPHLTLSNRGQDELGVARDCVSASVETRFQAYAEASILATNWSIEGFDIAGEPQQLWSSCKPWTGLARMKGSSTFTWPLVDTPSNVSTSSDSIDLTVGFTEDETTASGYVTNRSTNTGPPFACTATRSSTNGTIRVDRVPMWRPDGAVLNYSWGGSFGGVTTPMDCERSMTEQPVSVGAFPAGTMTHYVNQRLRPLLEASNWHRIDATFDATLDQLCTHYRAEGCNFQAPQRTEERSGSYTARIRVTDLPDRDADGIPDSVDARPSILDPL